MRLASHPNLDVHNHRVGDSPRTYTNSSMVWALVVLFALPFVAYIAYGLFQLGTGHM